MIDCLLESGAHFYQHARCFGYIVKALQPTFTSIPITHHTVKTLTFSNPSPDLASFQGSCFLPSSLEGHVSPGEPGTGQDTQ